jgi:hypothetical protein
MTATNTWQKNILLCVAGLWFTLGAPVSSTNKTDRHDRTEILLKTAFNSLTLNLTPL